MAILFVLIWLLTTGQICPKFTKIAKVGSKVCQTLKSLLKIFEAYPSGKILPNLDTLFPSPYTGRYLSMKWLPNPNYILPNVFFTWAIPGLFFLYFRLFNRFEPRTSGIGSDRSTNWAIQPLPIFCQMFKHKYFQLSVLKPQQNNEFHKKLQNKFLYKRSAFFLYHE